MKLIVGLGNPELRHAGTRHNIGFDIIERLSGGASFSSGKGNFRFTKISAPGGPLILVKPMTYMNLSGHAVVAAMNFWKIRREELLVICDDVNIPLGSVRIRKKGSAGGQNGLKHIIESLGSEEFARLRVGVGTELAPDSLSSFVLAKFTVEERGTIEKVITVCVDAVMDFSSHGIDHAMNHFNRAMI
ncbi:MAG: aminoacyl-tRNA hydrolase [Chlorobiaceae bacterium]|jgi:peptidyl-tRNA hydrolase, PTH1 family|nr:aminoacyl-tRNA hydrolase [Chlorobiaceae bacterium]